jgi:NTP pyrophosphatase (non-canonical NTP hydrolase)
MNELIDNIIKWGEDRKIIGNGTPQAQVLKLMSEAGELADNIGKKRYGRAMDDIGDCAVVLIMIASQIGVSFEDCLKIAYEDIKDRKGYLNEEGIFIKEGDV